MASMLRTYSRLLEKHPWKVQMLQTGVLMGLGDLAAQTIVEKKKLSEIEGGRMMRFALIGTLYVGPALRGWYGYLDKTFGPTGAKTVLKKVATDQLVFAPYFMASVLALIEASRNGRDWEKTKTFVRSCWLDIMVANWCIWPAVQFGNFYMVPLEYRTLVNQGVAVFWNTYLAWKTNLDDEARKKKSFADRQHLTLDDYERAGI